MKQRIIRSAASISLLCLPASVSIAQAPRTIAFQGRLTNATGGTLPDGNRTVTFRLYNGPAGPIQVTGELHSFATDTITLEHTPVVPSSEAVANGDGTVTYTRGTAYTIDNATGVITRVSSSTIPDNTMVKVSYQYLARKLWEETKSITVTGGLFSTALGDTVPLPGIEAFNQPLDVGVQVGTDPEMLPRTDLGAAPVALSLALPYSTTFASAGPVMSVTNNGGSPAILATQGTPSGVLAPAMSGVRGDGEFLGVLGTSAAYGGVMGRSLSGFGVSGYSDTGPGVVGYSGGNAFWHHAASIDGYCLPGAGVGLFAGDLQPYGVAAIQTNLSAGSTHIWCSENDTEVFSVTAGGAVCGLSFNQCSDVRYKRDVQTLRNPLASVLALRGVSFEWDPKSPSRTFPKGRQVGLVAQEVEKVLPEVVSTDRDGYKSVAYQGVVPVLVEALKAQQKEISRKDQRITSLEQHERALEARIERLESAAWPKPTRTYQTTRRRSW